MVASSSQKLKRTSQLLRNTKRDRYILLMVIPAVIFFVIFHYVPMYGSVIAFKKFNMTAGILGSPWAGLRYVNQFFSGYYLERLVSNTVILSIYNMIQSLALPIILALLLNEVKNAKFKKLAQTASYLPHFVSLVVVVGIMMNMFNGETGIINAARSAMGLKKIAFFSIAKYFRPLYIGSEIWQHVGWNSIIYLASISGINQEMYEAARVDGINRWQAMFYITLPSIMPTIIVIFILNIGSIMNLGFEKIILMYSPAIYETADVLSTYVYRRGIINAEYSYGAVVGLFNSVINLMLLLAFNALFRKVGETSLF